MELSLGQGELQGSFLSKGGGGTRGGPAEYKTVKGNKTKVHFGPALFERTGSYGGFLKHPERYTFLLLNADRVLRSSVGQWEVQT